MVDENPPQGKGTGSRCASTGNQKPDQPGHQAADNWSFPISSAFLYGELPPRLQRAVQIVECRLRSGYFTWAKPELLAAEYGCELRNWQLIMADLVRRGWWLVIKLDPHQKKTLTIIIALRRIDEQKGTFTPGVNTLESIRETVRLRRRRQRRLPMEYVERPPADLAQSVARNRAAGCAESRNFLRDLQAPLPFEEGLKSNALKENANKTTTTAHANAPESHAPSKLAESSSFFERLEKDHRTTTTEVAPMKAQADQASVELVERTMDLFEQGRTWAKAQLEGSYREHRARPAPPGVVFTWDWLAAALDEVDRHNSTQGNRRVRTWGFVHNTLEHFWDRGGPPPRRRPPAPSPRPEPRREIVVVADPGRETELRDIWDRMTESDRESIRAKVRADNPGMARWPRMLEPLYLAAVADRAGEARGRSVGSDTVPTGEDAPDGDGDAFPGFWTLARPPPGRPRK